MLFLDNFITIYSYCNFFSQMKPLVACTLSWRALSTLLPSNRKLMLRRLMHNRPKRLSEMFQKASDIPKEGETTSVSHKVCYLKIPFINLQISYTNVSLQIQINLLEEEIKWKSLHCYFIHGTGIMVLLLIPSSLIISICHISYLSVVLSQWNLLS